LRIPRNKDCHRCSNREYLCHGGCQAN
jgi:radical SAM protein with 4Fe4S-binding SPASM domain